jgi:hypothetical protein
VSVSFVKAMVSTVEILVFVVEVPLAVRVFVSTVEVVIVSAVELLSAVKVVVLLV